MPDPALLAERRLAWPDCDNVRDLGGLPVASDGYIAGGRTRFGSVVRADSLQNLIEAGWRALLAHGVRTVIDLRDQHERTQEPYAPPNGLIADTEIALLSLPLRCGGPDVERLFAAADTLEEAYVITVDHCQANVAAVLRAVAHARPGGVAIHCQSGRDRTAIITALLLALAGVPAEVIAADYRASQGELWPRWEAAMAAALADPAVANDAVALEAIRRQQPLLEAETMLYLLRHIDTRYGGAAGYLAAIGLSVGERKGLVERMLECECR